MGKKKRAPKRRVLLFEQIGKPLYFILFVPIYFLLVGVNNLSTKLLFLRLIFLHIKTPSFRLTRFHFTRLHFIACSLILVFGALATTSYIFYKEILENLPTPNDLINHQPNVSTKIYDREGRLLYKIYKDENRSLIRLSDLPRSIIDATIAIEDKDFYRHKGFSLRGIIRALSVTLQTGHLQGGSTITQQLVKNTVLTPERTLKRKLKEIILALQVENALTKDQILEMYLNQVSYGGSIYGIEEASENYFHISAKNLSLAQSSFLAGLPAAPSIYSPVGPNPELALSRQHEVLRRMVEDGVVSPIEAEAAKRETISIAPLTQELSAPHFVMYVRSLLATRYGEDLVTRGGLEVTTSLDLDLQTRSETVVKAEVASLAPLRVTNGAALITNPQNGQILAMVGSRDFFDIKNDGQVNVTLRPRQPGSSIKPLMYSAALEHGFTPATILDDSPITFTYPHAPSYSPRNYDGTYHGKEPLRFALANSHNVPAVKTLAAIGLNTFISRARALGISTWDDSSRFGLSLTLGGGEVLMTDMATAYGTFANEGGRVDLNPILTIKDPHGNVLYENPCNHISGPCHPKAVVSPEIAYQITNILSDNFARSRAFGTNSVLNIPNQEVAVKTGTTNGLRDNWTIGYTTDRVIAVWVGNNDNTPMSRVTSGITGASPIWNKLMRLELSDSTPHRFSIPRSLHALSLCAGSAAPSCGSCSVVYTEYFLPGTEPAITCLALEHPSPTPSLLLKNPQVRLPDRFETPTP